MFLQKVCLHDAPAPGCFVPHFLEKRLKLTFFQGCYKGGVIGLNSQLTDPAGQRHPSATRDPLSLSYKPLRTDRRVETDLCHWSPAPLPFEAVCNQRRHSSPSGHPPPYLEVKYFENQVTA